MSIEVSGLTKCYGEFPAVDNISFSVSTGEILGYLGPNGAGKSTTVKMLIGILPPTSGRITIDGVDMLSHAVEMKQRIGYVPEAGGIYESLTGYEFLQLIGRLYHLSDEIIDHKIREFFRLFSLDAAINDRLASYSKGMRQKVLISAALLHNPDILFFDEPLNGLDANSMLIFKEILRHLAEQGKTIFYCSHVLDVVERLCKRVIIIDRGKITADAPVAQLKETLAQGSLEDVFKKLTNDADVSEIARQFSAAVTST